MRKLYKCLITFLYKYMFQNKFLFLTIKKNPEKEHMTFKIMDWIINC